jgi:hypothetical protein
MEIFYFLIIFILILSLLLILYSKIYNDFQEKILKLKETESEIDDTLRIKYDIFVNINNILKNSLKGKELKTTDELNDIEKVKDENLSSFDFYRKLIDYEAIIIKIGIDIKKVQKIDEFSDALLKIEEINIKLNAQIKYYNEAITSYSVLYSRFPSNIIAKVSRFEEKTYFDNKNLSDKRKDDFQI